MKENKKGDKKRPSASKGAKPFKGKTASTPGNKDKKFNGKRAATSSGKPSKRDSSDNKFSGPGKKYKDSKTFGDRDSSSKPGFNRKPGASKSRNTTDTRNSAGKDDAYSKRPGAGDRRSGKPGSTTGKRFSTGKTSFDSKRPDHRKDKPERGDRETTKKYPKESSGKRGFGDKGKSFGEKKTFKRETNKNTTGSGFLGKKGNPENKEKSFSDKVPFKRETKSYTGNRDKDFTEKRNNGEDKPKSKSFDKKPFKKTTKTFSKPGASKKKAEPVEEGDGLIRLNRYIANAGICSRRDADNLIAEGLVSVNGEVVVELGYKVKQEDVVRYDGRKLNRETLRYILLNKPKDFITTMDDPQERKTVIQLIAGACKERVFPVGRLDRNTTGLLLLTNDGELTEKLTHPSNKIKKIYQVDLDKPIIKTDLETIIEGKVRLDDGLVRVDEIEVITPDKKTLGLEIHEGRNRIVRRIFESLGYDVVKLDRVMYASLTKKDLPRGHWRFLTEKEVVKLKFQN